MGSDRESASSRHTFPGGRARLPLINGSTPAEQEAIYVGTAFRSAPPVEHERTTGEGFEQYYSYESLFREPEPTETEQLDRQDPYAALGVAPGTPWPAIVKAHRRLAKHYHPDRFVGQPAEAVERAEAEFRKISAAWDELRRRHGK